MPKPFYRRRQKPGVVVPRIAPAALEQFVARPLADYDFMKTVPREELVEEVRSLKYRFCSDPWVHQLACFMIGTVEPAFLYYLDMSAGKSKLIADLFRFRKQRKEASCMLVVVPELIHLESWVENLRNHTPDLRVVVLTGSKLERVDLLKRKADVFLINQAGLQVYMCGWQQNKKTKKQEHVVDPDMAAAFVTNFDFLAIDEIHRVVSHDSLLFKLLTWLCMRCPFRYGLTGTPFGRDPSRLWPQFNLIDRGETLGQTLSIFRAVFFTTTVNKWGGYQHKFRPEQTELLNRVIKNKSISYPEDELSELPKRLPMRLPVNFTEEGAEYYQRIVNKLKETRGDYRSLSSPYIRMRQLASGFLSLKPEDDDESNERIEVRIKNNPKLDALRALIEDRILDRKFIVYHHFRFSGQMIAELFDKMKVKYAAIRGGMKDVRGEFRRFLDDPKCQGLIANTQVGSESINPQAVCNIEIYFESPENPITRAQAEKRVRRRGQIHKHVLIYDIIVKGTIEEKLLQYHREGKNLLQAVMKGDESLIEDEVTV